MQNNARKLVAPALFALSCFLSISLPSNALAQTGTNPPPESVPIKETRATGTGSFEWASNTWGNWQSLFVELPADAASIEITSVQVRGDLAENNQWIEFGLPPGPADPYNGGDSYTFQGSGTSCSADYTAYNYTLPQPELLTIGYQRGFYHSLVVPTTVRETCFPCSSGECAWGFRMNYTYLTEVQGPPAPPALASITPGESQLTLNLVPGSSEPTADDYLGYCGRTAERVTQSLNTPVSIASSGYTYSSLTPTTDNNRVVSGNVTGSVSLTHQWRGELEITLISPAEYSTTLWTGEELDSETNLSFSFSSEDFDGVPASGDWTLMIHDRVSGDGGTLTNWNLAFNTREELRGYSESPTVVIDSLTNGETYSCYAIASVYTSVKTYYSDPSNTLSALVGNTPGKPTISVAPEDAAAIVTVTSVANGGLDVTEYEALCQSSEGSVTTTSETPKIEVQPLTNQLGYLCKARAKNQQGWGPYSEDVKVRPEEQLNSGLPIWLLYVASNTPGTTTNTQPNGPTAPGQPGVPTGTAGLNNVTLNWSAPASNGGSPITGYRIQGQGDTASFETLVSNTGEDSTTNVIAGLTNDVAYQFRVAAINAVGVGPYSGVSSAVTPTNNAYQACSNGIASCQVSDLAPSTNFGVAIPAGKILAIPFTLDEEFSSGAIQATTNQSNSSDWVFHFWWSEVAAGPPLTGDLCARAYYSARFTANWTLAYDGAPSYACPLSFDGDYAPLYWFNAAVCDSTENCLPENGRSYFPDPYYFDVFSN